MDAWGDEDPKPKRSGVGRRTNDPHGLYRLRWFRRLMSALVAVLVPIGGWLYQDRAKVIERQEQHTAALVARIAEERVLALRIDGLEKRIDGNAALSVEQQREIRSELADMRQQLQRWFERTGEQRYRGEWRPYRPEARK